MNNLNNFEDEKNLFWMDLIVKSIAWIIFSAICICPLIWSFYLAFLPNDEGDVIFFACIAILFSYPIYRLFVSINNKIKQKLLNKKNNEIF